MSTKPCAVCGKFCDKKIVKQFCSEECRELSKIKKCKSCGEEFICRLRSQRYCNKCDKCFRARASYNANNCIEKACKECGKIFKGKRKVLLCEKCKKELPSPLIHHYDTIERDVLCPRCGEIIGKEKIKNSWVTSPFTTSTKLCKCCREIKDFQIELNKILRKSSDEFKRDISKKYKIDEFIKNHDWNFIEVLKKEKEHRKILREELFCRYKEKREQDEKDLLEKKKHRKTLREELFRLYKEKREQDEKERLEKKKRKEEYRKLSKELNEVIKIEKEKNRQKSLLKRKERARDKYLKEKAILTQEEREERDKKNREKSSERMKKNNPMKRPEVVQKVKETQSKKDWSEFKRGPNHKSWKGNRGFNLDCRSRLYKIWIRKVLERDQFKCTMCDSNEKLQVHHIRPLRFIIELVLKNNNINHIKEVDTKSSLYEKLIEEVLHEHKMEDGITLCWCCHDKIDDRYRRYKGKKHENKESI